MRDSGTGHRLHFPLKQHYQERVCFSRDTNINFFFLFRLCLRRCKFLQLGDPAGLSLDAFHPLGTLARCATAKQKHMCALVISGEEIPQIHSATRAWVLPKSRAPGDGTGDPFTATPELWELPGAGGKHEHLDPMRWWLPERCHSTCLML